MSVVLKSCTGSETRKRLFLERGWCDIPYDRDLADWVERTLPAARRTVSAPKNANWLRSGGTWFIGVNALPNDKSGAIADGPPLPGAVVDFVADAAGLSNIAWDRAQVSVCYPGYPRPMAGESDTAFQYRRKLDAAHLDGLLSEGPGSRRHLRQYHAFILGVPMVEVNETTSPMAIWEGSHEITRQALQTALGGIASRNWGDVDLTETYKATRRRIFQRCRRVTIVAKPGQAYLVHRLALHGMAPWSLTAGDPSPDGRMVVYFRPEIVTPESWLHAP